MKKSYVSPAIEITEFKAEDIVRTSMFAGVTTAASGGVTVAEGAQVGDATIASVSAGNTIVQFTK